MEFRVIERSFDTCIPSIGVITIYSAQKKVFRMGQERWQNIYSSRDRKTAEEAMDYFKQQYEKDSNLASAALV